VAALRHPDLLLLLLLLLQKEMQGTLQQQGWI
jgi:hypothetical protein